MTKNTHDEMKMWRDLASVSGLISATFSGEQIRAIVALVDAERERAEKAEADCDIWCKNYDEQGKVLNAIRTERDALAAQRAEARQQIAAEGAPPMTEQLYRRRAGEPVRVWRVGDGEPPEWVREGFGGYPGWLARSGGIVVEDRGLITKAHFEVSYEPLPAPAPDARIGGGT